MGTRACAKALGLRGTPPVRRHPDVKLTPAAGRVGSCPAAGPDPRRVRSLYRGGNARNGRMVSEGQNPTKVGQISLLGAKWCARTPRSRRKRVLPPSKYRGALFSIEKIHSFQ